MRLLIAEDDAALRSVLIRRLTAEGYAVDGCANGTDAMDFLDALAYDGAILDIMMPGLTGLEVLARMREKHIDCPVLMLTARDGIADRVAGLDTGADDYLVKPFAFDELFARLRALLRKRGETRAPTLAVGDLTMDTAKHRVARGGHDIRLTAKEFALLEYFMRNAGQVLTRNQIIDHVWTDGYSFETNLVDVYVRYLRTKIDADGRKRMLLTVRGVGYTLRAEE